MTRLRWHKQMGEFLPVDHEAFRTSSKLNIINDACEPFKCMATGKWFDSKSNYRGHCRDNGYYIVGNDYKPPMREE